jgi:integrase
MATSIRYRYYRGEHCLRRRGTTLTGAKVDETRQIPLATFLARDPTLDFTSSKARDRARIEQVAREIARDEERRDNDPQEWARGDDGREFTWTKLVALYLELNASRLLPASLKKNSSQAAHLIRVLEKEMRLLPSQLTVTKLERYGVQRISVEGASPKTVHLECAFARQLVQWGLDRADETHIERIAISKLPDFANKRGVRPKTILSESQLFALLKAARLLPRRGDVLRRIIAFEIGTRLRRAPLLALRGEWTDRHESHLNIPAIPGIVKGRLHHRDPISIPLPRIALDAIKDLPADGPLWTSMFRRAPSAEDGELLVAAALDLGLSTRNVAIVSLTKRRKIRAADVAALRWSQVDFDQAEIHAVQRTVGQRKKSVSVKLDADDVERLRELSSAAAGGEFVFSADRVKPLSVKTIFDINGTVEGLVQSKDREEQAVSRIERSLSAACRLANVPRVGLQGLRRSATQLLREHECPIHVTPVNEEVIERLLGHAPAALKAAYGFVSDFQMRDALARVDCAHTRQCSDGHVIEFGAVRKAQI